jgi:hypothetical protein
MVPLILFGIFDRGEFTNIIEVIKKVDRDVIRRVWEEVKHGLDF